MELVEPIETLNKRLVDHFGIDSEGSEPIFRIVWSSDEYEHRLSETTKEGLSLIRPEVQYLPKYQWCRERWILERLVIVPDVNVGDIPATKKSYEPLWVFQDNRDGYLPPIWNATKLIIDTLYAALGKKSMAKYVDDEAKNPVEAKQERINKLVEELFGDESNLLGRTITGEAVAYTGEPKI